MPDPKNDDKEIPHVPIGEKRPVLTNNFHATTIPIFWGPGQLCGPYNEPPLAKWHGGEVLAIPKVARFLYATTQTYDTDGFKKTGGGGPPPDPYYKIVKISDHQPPFPYDFVIYYNVGPNVNENNINPFFFFSTTQYIYIGSDLVNVGASLSVGMKWRTYGPAFNYIHAGIDGPGWYPNSGIPLSIINFF